MPCPVAGSVKVMPLPPDPSLPGPCGSPGTTAGTGTGSALPCRAAAAIFNYTTSQGCCPPSTVPWPLHPAWGRFPSPGSCPPPHGTVRGGTARPWPRPAVQPHTEPGCRSGLLGGAPTAEGDMQGCVRRQVRHTRRPATGRRHKHGTRYQEPAGGWAAAPSPARAPSPPGRPPPCAWGGWDGAGGLRPLALCHQLCGGSGRGVPAGGDWGELGGSGSWQGGTQRAWGGVTPQHIALPQGHTHTSSAAGPPQPGQGWGHGWGGHTPTPRCSSAHACTRRHTRADVCHGGGKRGRVNGHTHAHGHTGTVCLSVPREQDGCPHAAGAPPERHTASRGAGHEYTHTRVHTHTCTHTCAHTGQQQPHGTRKHA